MADVKDSHDPALAPEGDAGHSRQSPWSYVPLLYFLEGIPYVMITGISVLMYNQMGIDKTQFALWTSLVGFAWTLKMFWGPLVETTLTKRRWVVITQFLLFVGLLAAVSQIGNANFFTVTIAIFAVLAFISATHDIAADGFYLLALDKNRQAFFVGVRSTAYRLATIFVSGYVVWLAGRFISITRESFEVVKRGTEPNVVTEQVPLTDFGRFLQGIDTWAEQYVANDVARAWTLALGFGVLVYGVSFLINVFVLPRPAADGPRKERGAGEQTPFIEAFASFFKQNKIFWILAFILFYRFGESMIGKLSATFLQDPATKGGLGVRTEEVGLITGIVGVVALLLGGILGGIVISKWGIKRSFWPMVLALNLPNFFYIWAAFAKPAMGGVATLIAVDQFGYGFGFAAYLVYLMFVSQGSRFQTANYAIATGLMALGAMVAGAVSGKLYDVFAAQDPGNAYAWFFCAVVLLGIPGIVTLFFIPMDKEDLKVKPVELD
jgi:MFS transporter, PAT family, beta-lactamase induction signal transducer AmpG